MLENIDLSCKVSGAAYKKTRERLEIKLGELQRRLLELKVPVIIVFEGWDAAGKGTLINELILPLDRRGLKVHSTPLVREEDQFYPFLWRFWGCMPVRGRIAVFDRSWYRRVLSDRVDGRTRPKDLPQTFDDIVSFERQLTFDGAVIVKLFLHISKKEQERRLKKLRRNRATAWRVTTDDWKHHEQYSAYLTATEEMLARTDSDFAPWTVVEAHDRRFASLKMFRAVIGALEDRVNVGAQAKAGPARKRAKRVAEDVGASVLDRVDLSLSLPIKEYRRKLDPKQKKLRELQYEAHTHRVPVVIVFEGWDAAGKGGNIRRLTAKLDPRGYEVVPIGAPNDLERAHHYLWRVWTNMPKAGHFTVFDRSWYGRVLVERVEGFCSEEEWKRAYREINEMEQHLTNFGTVLLKFWLHIDADVQLKRFREREKDPHKRWKITAEDWRNREKADVYKAAVEEMLFRTSTSYAPWTIVESNCNHYARIKVLDTVVRAIKARIDS